MSFRATLELLSTSVIVAVSGGFKLYAAFLLLGIEPDISSCLAFSFLVYSVYTLDRTLESVEDITDDRHKNASRAPAILGICITILISLLLVRGNTSLFAVFFPLIIGFMYSRGLKIGRTSVRLKGGIGIKNLVTAFTWGFTLALFLYHHAEILPVFFTSIFFFSKSFINTIIYDYRDVEGDVSAGLATLPVYLGESKAQVMLGILHFILHLGLTAVVLTGVIRFEPVIIIYSIVAGFIYILLYANNRNLPFRDVIIDGEWIIAVLLRNLAIQLSWSASHNS